MCTRNVSAKRAYRQQLGIFGESLAAEYIQNVLGWKICERNWRCRSGEIDLVALDGNSVVFVEVRTKCDGGRFGTAVDSVNVRKLRQMERMGRIYIHAHREMSKWTGIRFDLVAIQVQSGLVTDFRHYRNVNC